tara:strand:- start:2129 stop:2455 length:327 start_codon:yes stop_codon:yes gene_type:complete
MYKILLVITTESNLLKAKFLSNHVLKKKLAVCASIKEIESFFIWKEVINEEKEYQIIFKTMFKFREEIIREIKLIHSYELPELITLEADASEEYFKWVLNNLRTYSKQ